METEEIKLTGHNDGGNTWYYLSGFTNHEAEILCVAIDDFGSGQHPCASPGDNNGLWNNAFAKDETKEWRGVGLRSFGARYIIDVCKKGLDSVNWEDYPVINHHQFISVDNLCSPKVVMESAITRLMAALGPVEDWESNLP